MIARINGVEFPIEPHAEAKPIIINVVIGNDQGWRGSLVMQIDCAADICALPLDMWLKIFGQPPRAVDTATAENAVGGDAQVVLAEISLRIETTDHEFVTLERVRCMVAPDGVGVLGLNVLALFKLTVSQNELRELRFAPRSKQWLGLAD